MTEQRLRELLGKARGYQMSAQERQAQRVSFAYGNTHIENPNITRAMVEQADRRLHPEDYRDD